VFILGLVCYENIRFIWKYGYASTLTYASLRRDTDFLFLIEWKEEARKHQARNAQGTHIHQTFGNIGTLHLAHETVS
jgi:hypothetical protein